MKTPKPSKRQVTNGGAPHATTLRKFLLPLLVATSLLVIWQGVSTLDSTGLVPTPWGILLAMPLVFEDTNFWILTLDTLLAILQGLTIGVVLGTLIGLLTGRIAWLRSLTAPYVSGMYAIPLLALVPLATIWLGYSPEARLVLIAVAALLPAIVSTSDGARKIPRELEDAAFVLRTPRHRVLFDLVFPATLPYVIAGAQVAIGRAVVAAIAVEFLASVSGLGRFILVNSRSFRPDEALVGVFVLVIIGLLGTALIEFIRKVMAPWHNPKRQP
jgi:ABC-type nitrate/sulfonate/bicarbonate transport system permease component